AISSGDRETAVWQGMELGFLVGAFSYRIERLVQTIKDPEQRAGIVDAFHRAASKLKRLPNATDVYSELDKDVFELSERDMKFRVKGKFSDSQEGWVNADHLRVYFARYGLNTKLASPKKTT